MALTRKFLSALGIEAEKQDEIIQAHTETVDGLKTERDRYKADAEKLPGVQAELDGMKKAAEEQDGKSPWKVKYDAIKEEYEQYKADQAAKESKAAKSAAYRQLLKDAGISEKRLDAVLKVSDVDAVELDKAGKIKGADKLMESVKAEWSDFITTTTTQGANTPNPPTNNGAALKSRADIYKTDERGRFVMDASQRQAALAQIIAAEQQKG